jgi:hypothetical protein
VSKEDKMNKIIMMLLSALFVSTMAFAAEKPVNIVEMASQMSYEETCSHKWLPNSYLVRKSLDSLFDNYKKENAVSKYAQVMLILAIDYHIDIHGEGSITAVLDDGNFILDCDYHGQDRSILWEKDRWSGVIRFSENRHRYFEDHCEKISATILADKRIFP